MSCELSKLGWSDGKVAPPMTWHVKLQITRSHHCVNRLQQNLQRLWTGPSPYRGPNLTQFRCPWRPWDLISRWTANFSVLTLQQISGHRNWMNWDPWIFLHFLNPHNLDYRMSVVALKSDEGKNFLLSLNHKFWKIAIVTAVEFSPRLNSYEQKQPFWPSFVPSAQKDSNGV